MTPTTPESSRGGTLASLLDTPIRLLPRRAGPRDADAVLRAADLPASLAGAVRQVIRHARLWRSERADVAGELCAHFLDGLTAGRTAEQLLRDFGSPRSAARLIRRAKRRARPLAWRAYAAFWAALGWLLLALLGLYAFLFVRYLLLEPQIRRNYTADFNARIAATPLADRAWPVYRSAALTLTPLTDGSSASFELPAEDAPRRLTDALGAWDVHGPALDEVRAYLHRNASALDQIRHAAELPALGAPLTDAPDTELLRHMQEIGQTAAYPLPEAPPRSDNPALLSLLFNHLAPMRLHARLLISDARLAFDEGDADRFEANIAGVLGLARQVREPESLISDLVAIAEHARVLEVIDRVLAERPDFLDDAQIARLAHALATIGRDQPLLRFAPERRTFQDTLQRYFSDDGQGNGVLTRRGVRELQTIAQDFGPTASMTDYRAIGDLALGPVQAALVADRRATTAMHDQLLGDAERLAATPLWQWDAPRHPDAQVERLFRDDLLKVRYVLIATLMPAYGQAALSAERLTQRRDATLAALALEAHRRRHGAYPATLATLVPALLPSVPTDRFTGEPLGYTLIDGRPTLYSRGVDRDDDGGRPPAELSPRRFGYRGGERVDAWRSVESVQGMLADPDRARGIDGDWILWPPPAPND